MPAADGLRLELTTRLAPDALAPLGPLLATLGLGEQRWPTRFRTRLTLTAHARRLDLLTGGPLGRNVSLVAGPGGSLWIQHDARVYVAVDRRAPRPSQPVPEPRAQRAAARQSRSGPAPIAAVLIDPGSGQSVRLTATPNPEWRAPELAQAALAALLGGPDGELPPGLDAEAWTRQFAEQGLPASLRVEALDPAGEPRLLAETKVESFEALPLEPGEFTAPRGYRKWRLGEKAGKSPARQKPGAGFKAAARHSFATQSEVGVSRQALDDRDGPGREPPDPVPPPKPPRPSFTTRPRIGLRIEQRLLDHLAMLFNAAVTPLRTVSVGQGHVDLDWLDQLRADVLRRGANAAGTAIFQLLHDVSLPATRVTPPPTPASDFASFSCRGLVDQMAIRDAEQRFRAGTYPQTTIVGLAPSMRNVIAAAGTNWDALPDGVKARLTFELVRREYGLIRLPFPTATPPDQPALGLVNFQATDIAGTLTLPPAPPPATTGDPPFNPLLSLTAGFGGTINGTLGIGTLGLTATIARWPTASYWLLLAGAVVVAIVIPALAWAIGIVAALATFLALDVVRASLTATGLSAALTIRFVPDARGVFVPVTSCTLSGTLSFGWASVVPTGIHQILAAIEAALLNAFRGTILTGLGQAIAAQVNGAVRGMVGDGFPATALRIGLPISGGTRGGRSGIYTYLEAELNPAANPRLPVPTASAPANLEAAQDADAGSQVPTLGADHYGSLSFDENFLNVALAGMRLAGLFDGAWHLTATVPLRPLMPAPLPRARIGRMYLDGEAGPTMTLVTNPAGQTSHGSLGYSALLSLFETKGTPVALIRFRVDTSGQLVLGSAVAPGESWGPVQIQTLPSRAFDLLLQQAGATITPVSFDLVTVQTIRTETIEFDDNGKPHKVVDVDQVETVAAVPLTPALALALDPLLRRVLSDAWWARGVQRAPRRDGIQPGVAGSGPVDPVTMFRYALGDIDPDAIGSEPHARAALGLERRLAHFHLAHAGLATAALLPIRSGSPVPWLATFSGANNASGILANVKVKASTTSGRDLSL